MKVKFVGFLDDSPFMNGMFTKDQEYEIVELDKKYGDVRVLDDLKRPMWEKLASFESWKIYRRIGLAVMRPYILGEDLSHISVNEVDDPPTDMGMIAVNPENPLDQWYVARKYFEDNFELVD